MNYKLLQKVKSLISYPLRLILLPFMLLMTFFMTDFNNEDDRGYFFGFIKKFIKPF